MINSKLDWTTTAAAAAAATTTTTGTATGDGGGGGGGGVGGGIANSQVSTPATNGSSQIHQHPVGHQHPQTMTILSHTNHNVNESSEFCSTSHYRIITPSESFRHKSYIRHPEEYERLYRISIQDPATFWYEIAKEFYWKRSPSRDKVLEYNFDIGKGPILTKWFQNAVTNICYNALDRHIICGRGQKIAYYWEGSEAFQSRSVTYQELKSQVCKLANFFKSRGLKKGHRIAIYMPVSIELAITMLAAVRIGVVHTVVFAGFSAESLAERILDADCSILITMDQTVRGAKIIPLKDIADRAMDICEQKGRKLNCCLVQIHNPDSNINNFANFSWNSKRDILWSSALEAFSDQCEPEWMDAEDELFILYTSGSTGKPKGVLHTLGGYMVYAGTTFKYIFDQQPQDVFFSTADLGWITGHTVNVYGSLVNCATIVLFEGTPFYPHPGRLWEIIDKHRVTIFYTAPTAIRSLMKFGENILEQYDLSSLRLLGTAGEPINAEAWIWYYRFIGKSRCPIVDTFWQTETGAPMISPLPGATPLKPGSATLPFFGVLPVMLDDCGKEIEGPGCGTMAFKMPWPSIARTIIGNHDRYESTYFSRFEGYFQTGDSCYRDKDGYYWITGRTDDMLNVSGHLLSTAQVESAIVEHPAIAEAAAVSAPHPIKGQCIYCFVVLKNNFDFDQKMLQEIKLRAREKIGALAVPEVVHPVQALPKTRSGKIMRRILSKVIHCDDNLGDISTMADESVLKELFATRQLYSITA